MTGPDFEPPNAPEPYDWWLAIGAWPWWVDSAERAEQYQREQIETAQCERTETFNIPEHK